jgi:hypothetical protein
MPQPEMDLEIHVTALHRPSLHLKASAARAAAPKAVNVDLPRHLLTD